MSSVTATQPGYDLALIDADNRHAAAADHVEAWLAALVVEGKRPRTCRHYVQTGNALLRRHPGKRLEEFTPMDLNRELAHYPERSRAVRAAHLRSLFKWARMMRIVAENPMEFVARPRQPEQDERMVFDETEVALLTGPGVREVRDRALMTVLFLSGVRINEARHLQGRHVDFAGRRLLVQAEFAKGGKSRRIRLRNLLPVLDELIALEGINPEDFLWYTRDGGGPVRRNRPVSESRFYGWFRDVLTEAGVPREIEDQTTGELRARTPHSCRHTMAVNWLRRGGGLERLSLMLGHEDPKTTWAAYVKPHLSLADVDVDLELVEG